MPTFRGKVHGELETIGYTDNDDGHGHQRVYALRGGPIVYVPMFATGGDCPVQAFMVDTYRFYPLGEDYVRDAVIAAVMDSPFWRLAVLHYWAQTIGARLLVTAHIWGLADWKMGEVPTWRNIYAFRWIARLMGR